MTPLMKFCLILFLLAFALTSCTKCSECVCVKNGVETIEKECATGIGQEDGLRLWEHSLTDKKGYDDCSCVQK